MTVRTDEFQTSTPTLLAKPTVHIVGFAASWADTPWGEPDAENWGMNALHKLAPDKPFHRWYQLHDIETHHTADRDEHVGWLANCGIPVYMWPEHADKWRPTIPTAVPFPRLAITDHFGRYFTNTVSWMIAHAIWEGRSKIGVYGVDMAQQTEYESQRPSCEYFLGWAAGSGVEVVIPPTSDLLKAPYLYGAEDGNPLRVKMESRLKELQGRQSEVQGQIQNLQNQMAQAQAALNQIAGAVEDTQYYLRAWTQPMVSDGKVPT